jgi:proteic killer suppression protein
MIRGFRHRGLKRLYELGDRSRVNPNHAEKIEVILADLDAAGSIDHMRRPGYRLHPLSGELKGFLAVDVSGNWRIVFRFDGGDVFDVFDVFDVDLLDYH